METDGIVMGFILAFYIVCILVMFYIAWKDN